MSILEVAGSEASSWEQPRFLGWWRAGSRRTLHWVVVNDPRTARMIRSLAGICAAFAAVAALAVSAPSASASTWNQKFSNLAWPPKGSYHQDRVVRGLHGKYWWVIFANNQEHPNTASEGRVVRLRGTYRMHDTIVARRGYYLHTAEMINVRTGGKVQQTQHVRLGRGVHHWGSYFQNVKAPPGG
jgi:hypothetical protein